MIMSGVEGKLVIVTGAAGLIGSVICDVLDANGARIALVDTNAKHAMELTQRLNDRSGRGHVCESHLDMLDADAIGKYVKALAGKFNKVDCLINCAYPRTKDWGAKFEDIKLESWQENVDAHMNGYFHMSQQVSRQFISQGFGNIINFSSIYGMVGPDFSLYEDLPEMGNPAAYAAIKGGITNLTRYMASYLGRHGVRVNAICPGGVFDGQNETFVKRYVSKVPLRRMATPSDIAHATLFLVSDLSSYISGVNLPVDGGWTAI